MGGGERQRHASTPQGRQRVEAEEADQETPAPKHDCLSHDLHASFFIFSCGALDQSIVDGRPIIPAPYAAN